MTEVPTLSEALGDVRRAYRLLWCYQYRILDVVRTIAEEFEDLKFYYFVSHNADPRDRTNSKILREPWFAFPLMNVSYIYRSSVDVNSMKPGEWLLDVRVVSDSGYDFEERNKIVDDPADFPAVDESKSKLDLYMFCCHGEIQGNLLRNVWEPVEWPDPDGQPNRVSGLPITGVGKSWDIADLPDRDAVRAAVSEFKAAASAALGMKIT